MNLLFSHDPARAVHHAGWLDDTTGPVVIEQAKQRLPWAERGGEPDTASLAEDQAPDPAAQSPRRAAPLLIDGSVIVLLRRLGDSSATAGRLTATNNSAQARSVELQLPTELFAALLRDALGGVSLALRAGKVERRIPALGVWVKPRASHKMI